MISINNTHLRARAKSHSVRRAASQIQTQPKVSKDDWAVTQTAVHTDITTISLLLPLSHTNKYLLATKLRALPIYIYHYSLSVRNNSTPTLLYNLKVTEQHQARITVVKADSSNSDDWLHLRLLLLLLLVLIFI